MMTQEQLREELGRWGVALVRASFEEGGVMLVDSEVSKANERYGFYDTDGRCMNLTIAALAGYKDIEDTTCQVFENVLNDCDEEWDTPHYDQCMGELAWQVATDDFRVDLICQREREVPRNHNQVVQFRYHKNQKPLEIVVHSELSDPEDDDFSVVNQVERIRDESTTREDIVADWHPTKNAISTEDRAELNKMLGRADVIDAETCEPDPEEKAAAEVKAMNKWDNAWDKGPAETYERDVTPAKKAEGLPCTCKSLLASTPDPDCQYHKVHPY